MKAMGISAWTKGIKGRLLLVAIFPFAAFGVIYTFTSSGLNQLSKLVESAHQEILPNVASLDEMRIAENRFGYRVWEGIVNPEDRPEVLKDAHQTLELFERAYTEYTRSSFDPEEEKLYNEYKDQFPIYLTTAKGIVADLEKGTPESVASARKVLDETLHIYSGKIDKFSTKVADYYMKRAERESKDFVTARTQITHIMILVTCCAGFAILGLLLLTAAKVSNSVGAIAENLSTAGGRVVDAVEQLTSAGNGLSQNATEAAASLEETVAALEEMSSMVKMNSDNAKQAASLAVSSRESAERGESEIKSLIVSMSEISQSSKKIEEIISVIDDIAFQTNLLALNAAVEAARAGEQGKGFAVVAEAVRALAHRSASSAKDIESLIKESVSQVEKGSKIADQSGEVLANIVTSIKKVSDLNNEISAASSEQTTGIQQISKAMNQLDQTSQSNAASAEEIAATSTEINGLAHRTQELTAELNVAVIGTSEITRSNGKVLAQKATPGPTAPAKPPAKVISMHRPSFKVSSHNTAQEAIPFDEDVRAKVGTTDGF
ncbi:MAG: methyl-accepting chemotaxis protein [Bdellovibrio sp.]